MRHEFASVGEMPPMFWRWSHVDPASQWACKGTGQIVVETEFLDRFEALRVAWGKPLAISSGYRSPAHNMTVSTTGGAGPHTTARAVDIVIAGADALALVYAAIEQGFTGVGLNQKGPHAGRMLHLDDLPAAPGQPRPWVWTY